MKTQKTITIAALAISLAGACTPAKTDLPKEPELIYREFTASHADSTKTVLEGNSVLWNASGESITVIDNDGNGYTLTQKSVSADRTAATFAGNLPDTGFQYAVYPASESCGCQAGTLSLDIPSVQTAVEGSFDPAAAYCVAKVSGGDALSFRNVCGLLGFSVNADGITSVTFSATEKSGGALTGSASVRFDGEAPEVTTDGGGRPGSVTISGALEKGKCYWAAVAPGEYSGLKVVFTDSQGRTATFSKDATISVARSSRTRISTFNIGSWDGQEEPGGTAMLTYSECSGSVKGYDTESSYTNGYGTWLIRAYNNKAIQLNSAKKSSYIRTPEFQGNIKSISVTNTGTSSATIYFCKSAGSTSELPSPNVSLSLSGSGTFTADVSELAAKCLYIRSQGVVTLTEVNVTWGGSGSVPPTPQTPAVTTEDAASIGTAEATLHASFSNIPTSPDPVAAFFRWGSSASALDRTAYDNSTILNTASGTFSATISSLEESTTYYYQAVMTLADGTDVCGSVKSFTTRSSSSATSLGYLDCYEVPAVNVSGSMSSGSETFGYRWYKYNTTNSMQAVATHTFRDPGRTVRNYTVLLDGNKKAPLWCATAFHASEWADNGVGRNQSWKYDPAFPESWQQSGVSSPYSKGHLIASNYRQSYVSMNKQTFYYSNQAPQYQTQFNDGVWNQMENRIVSIAPSGRDTLYVVVGTLYEGTAKYSDGIQVPSHFYTCVMKCSFNTSGTMTAATGCAYLYTNEAHPSSSYSNFATTIDAVEQRSGFDFFHNLPDNLETAAESKVGSVL